MRPFFAQQAADDIHAARGCAPDENERHARAGEHTAKQGGQQAVAWYAGKNKAVTSIETESKTVAIIELSRKRQPRNFHAIRKIGTLIAITITPIGVWNRWLSSVAIPLTPPGAI